MIKSRTAGRIKDVSNVIRTLNSQIRRDKCLYPVSTGSIWYDSNKNAGFKRLSSVYAAQQFMVVKTVFSIEGGDQV